MKLRQDCVIGRSEWGVLVWLALALFSAVRPATGAPPSPPQSPSNTPLAAAEAVRRIKMPDGFTASLFAAEPDVVQPIAMTIDHRGRLWVVENYSYPVWLGGPRARTGSWFLKTPTTTAGSTAGRSFSTRGPTSRGSSSVSAASGCARPRTCSSFPTATATFVPTASPIVKLDGWDTKAQHNMFNGLEMGARRLALGLQRHLVQLAGRPARHARMPQRVAINCGVWRYHPTRAVFEAVAHGTTNPWGLDFDDLGEAFITNCVIPHLFHVVPGAHFQRMYGEDLAPYRYALLETCADHIHWAGGKWTDSREGKGKHGEAGGGHAHVGAMIYLGDNWPDRYRNDVFTCNIHGKRINRDRLERRGSSYVARHEPDFLMANDPWFRGLELKYGPDGAVYMTDWYDTGECHETDADNAHRENGRIYKIVHGKAAAGDGRPREPGRHGPGPSCSFIATTGMCARPAGCLQERAAAGRDLGKAHGLLREILATNPDATRQLRAVWALYASGGLDDKAALALLDHASEHVRAWGVRLLCDRGTPRAGRRWRGSPRWPRPTRARRSASAWHRPCSACRSSERWPIAVPLASHKEDAVRPDAPPDDLVWSGTAGAGRPCRGPWRWRRAANPHRAPVRGAPHGRRRPRRRPGRRRRLCSRGRATRLASTS